MPSNLAAVSEHGWEAPHTRAPPATPAPVASPHPVPSGLLGSGGTVSWWCWHPAPGRAAETLTWMPGPAAGAQGYAGHRGREVASARGGFFLPQGPIVTPGNIRVLCRLRPGVPCGLVTAEPGPGGTISTCYRGRQRRFRLDWVFPPDASQEEVTLHSAPVVPLPVTLPCPPAAAQETVAGSTGRAWPSFPSPAAPWL